MSFDLAIFDCDGVLVDSEVISCRCLLDALTIRGIDASVDEVADKFLGRSMAFLLAHYRSRGHILAEDFRADVAGRLRAAFRAELKPVRDVARVLPKLAARCVASSSDIERVRFSLEVTGLSEFFSGRIYTAEMVPNGKPAPDLFLYAAKQMGVPPARSLVIEDSVSGVMAGKAAGMTVWGFTGGSHYSARDGRVLLEAAGADRVFDRMADFDSLQAIS